MARRGITRPSVLSLKIVYNLFVNKEGITIKDVANNLKIDYKNIHESINGLFNIGIVKKEKIGNYNICKLNYSNEDIVEYLKEYNFYMKMKEFRKRYPSEYRIIIETCKKLKDNEEHFFICLIFGSYAKNEEKKGSDIDILFLTDFSRGIIPIKTILNKINRPYQKKFHLLEQSVINFVKDLKNKSKLSIATEIYKEPPIVFYGDDIFFRIIIGTNGNFE